ncbi:MAG TPA: CPBP family glutamic-type intramembrane protease [Chloroflexota bacterium]|nr:CPBP family glutamic-type intramembrane protease [Chloroflexota bacterium]
MGERADGWPAAAAWQAWAAQVGIGAVLGLLLVGGVFVIELAAGWLIVRGVAAGALIALAVGLGRAIAVAVVEEAVFRGALLGYLQRPLGSAGAAAVSSVAFALAHAWNTNATPLAIANLVVAGVLFALACLVARGSAVSFAAEEAKARGIGQLAYALGRGLPLPVGIHAAWNFFEGSAFGLPVSGSPRDSLLAVSVSGPDLLTGGAFGPEGGLLGLGATIVVGLMLWAVRGRVPRAAPLTAL